ncbi:MAG TPA: CDP-alcohol phosphatidyltransferase family protein [Longimicrobiales bacterium]|nr:CDP-alcohol phosphatidyltransferase family protein [Longimicrobiales bacterium]
MAGGDEGAHARTSEFVLKRFERWALPRLAARLPGRVMPDHMTALGLFASTMAAVAYALTNRHEAWLWVASAALIVNWYGDSLDGTLARFRRIERPRYGYYLDHLTDAYSTMAIGLGLGFSPYMLLAVGLAIVIAYLLLSINVYLETHVFKEFSFSYGNLGPTEVRILLIVLNTLALTLGPLPFEALGVGATIFDVAGLAAVLGMVGVLLLRAGRNLRVLARLEPPGRPTPPG